MTDSPRTAPDGSPMSEADLLREQRLQRNLKILIAGMGVLILLGLGAVVLRIVTGGGAEQQSVRQRQRWHRRAAKLPSNCRRAPKSSPYRSPAIASRSIMRAQPEQE